MVGEPKMKKFHLHAYSYLIENQKLMRDLILNYLFKSYPGLQEKYGYDDDEKSLFMPDLESKEELKQLIGISELHIMNVEKNDMAYVGYQFKCKWDTGHGIGFMTHGNKIVDFGGGSVSFLTWVARKDLERKEEH